MDDVVVDNALHSKLKAFGRIRMEHHGAAFEVLIRQRLPLHLTHGSWARSPLDGPGWVEALRRSRMRDSGRPRSRMPSHCSHLTGFSVSPSLTVVLQKVASSPSTSTQDVPSPTFMVFCFCSTQVRRTSDNLLSMSSTALWFTSSSLWILSFFTSASFKRRTAA